MGNLADDPVTSSKLLALERFAHEFQRISGSREMVERPEGEWVKHEDVVGAYAFIEGYLLEHQNMLSHLGAHTAIVKAVEWIRRELKSVVEQS